MLSLQVPLGFNYKGCNERHSNGRHSIRPCCSSYKGRSLELGNSQLKALRKASQELARQKKLVVTQVGRKGATNAFVENLQLALKSNKFVKVQAGGCDTEVEDLLVDLEEKTDSVCVHKIGHTATFYRKSD